MFRPRVIPCLLLKEEGLVKTVRFKDPKYIGDPINAVRIFNEKEADELVFLDIMASRVKKGFFRRKRNSIPFEMISKISRECFMPLTYGGGVTKIDDIKKLFSIGVEKVAINSHAIKDPQFIKEASEIFGAQSIIVSIDVKMNDVGNYEVFSNGGSKPTGLDPVEFTIKMESMGAGEVMINSIDRDGTMVGYDIDLIKRISDKLKIPVIACGGARNIEDFRTAYFEGHASALAAGSLFVFHGRMKAVLISYPEKYKLESIFKEG